jgi:hypothetical protein
MGQERVAGSIQVKVALIGVVSAVSVALITHWDSFAPGRVPAIASVPALVAPAPAPSATPSQAAAPSPVPVASQAAAVQSFGAAQTRAFDAGSAALDQVAARIEAASAPDLTGTWRDEGYSYRLVQQGGRFAFIQLQNGVAVGTGGGTVDGNMLDHRFTGPAGNGACRGTVAPSGDTIEGQCSAGGLPWTFVVTRESDAAS